jgi:predicted Fe-Mo cluster-binding NifX family protein
MKIIFKKRIKMMKVERYYLGGRSHRRMEGERRMKIAIASLKGAVCPHFGYCEEFVLCDVENGQVNHQENLPNPGHRPGFLPLFLKEHGVDVIITGGMGSGAVELFEQSKIKILTGITGSNEMVIQKWVNGELESTGSVCFEHQHHGNC